VSGDRWSKRVVDDDGNVHRYEGEKGKDEHNHIIYNSEGDMIYFRSEDRPHHDPNYANYLDTEPTKSEPPHRTK
jgi:hypothetical protein